MHSCQYIEENRCFINDGTNLHIHTIAQGRPEDNQVEFLQGPHGIVNRPKNLVLNNIRRFTMEHIGAANGLLDTKLFPKIKCFCYLSYFFSARIIGNTIFFFWPYYNGSMGIVHSNVLL